MKRDAFSDCHPAVAFVYFVGAIGFGVTIQHPAYLLAGVLGALSYYLLLKGKQGWKLPLGLLPLFLFLTAVNPLFNTQGERILFSVCGRPYTLEALLYGAAIAGIFVVMSLWFGCYNEVMTSDKFTGLFGGLIPGLSLLLVMVLRMIPSLMRKAGQISGARRSIGKGDEGDRVMDGMTVLSALTSFALEGSVVTADSMRSRGYGVSRRTSFQLYRMTGRDWAVLALALVLGALVLAGGFRGSLSAGFTPELSVPPVDMTLAAYGGYLLIPTLFHLKEAVLWHIFRSRI